MALTEYQLSADVVSLLDYLLGTILDGRTPTSRTASSVLPAGSRKISAITPEEKAAGVRNISSQWMVVSGKTTARTPISTARSAEPGLGR
ncbi:hypothetical protein ACW2Q0_17350 [Nocardia sp. R16R-3T]